MDSCQDAITPPKESGLLDEAIMEWTAIFARLWMYEINRFNRETGLTFGQMNLLLHIHYHGPCKVSDVSELLQVSPPGASQMVERMVQQGLVKRREVSGDRRVRLVELTEQGQRKADGSVNSHLNWIRNLAGRIEPDQRKEAARHLRELTDKASQMELV